MKRETCKILLENGILQAYAEGKTIVWNGKDIKDDLEIGFYNPSDSYSIKKEPEWRPFTCEELKTIMGKVIVAKDKSRAYLTTKPFINNYIGLNNSSFINNIELFESYTFVDGSPCGVFE
jgi:hypothetical protein